MTKIAICLISSMILVGITTNSAYANPRSINFSTRTDDILGNDFNRIADMAASISSMTGRLAYHMYSISNSDCNLIGGCSDAVKNYIDPISLAARELSQSARYYYDHDDLDERKVRMESLRTQYFNQIAVHQYNLRQLIENSNASLSGIGHGDADAFCSYIFDAYWILMNMIVDYPRAAGLGGGRGTDD